MSSCIKSQAIDAFLLANPSNNIQVDDVVRVNVNSLLPLWPLSQLKEAILEGGVPFNRVHGMHAFDSPRFDPRFNQVFNVAMSNSTHLSVLNPTKALSTSINWWMLEVVLGLPLISSSPNTLIFRAWSMWEGICLKVFHKETLFL